MKCIHCGREFFPKPPRRLVCSVCIHDREKRKLELARTAALAKRAAERKAAKAEADYQRGQRYTAEKQAEGAPVGNRNAEKQLDNKTQKPCPVVSTADVIAKESRVPTRPNLWQRELNRIWRELNVIPFPLSLIHISEPTRPY